MTTCVVFKAMQLWKKNRRRNGGVSLTELLCVLVILAILAALYLPAISRAFVRVKKFLGGF